MASGKNQHFVPQFLLRRFSENGTSKHISVFNIQSSKFIPSASIKGQCSKAFFYGHEPGAEEILADLEGLASSIINRIEHIGIHSITFSDRIALFLFIVTQKQRTQSAINDAKMMNEEFHKIINDGDEMRRSSNFDFRIGEREIARKSIHIAMQSFLYMLDMPVKVLRNNTSHPLIISDNPVVLFNKMRQKSRTFSVGLASSGVICYIPISLRSALLIYDRGIYSAASKHGDILIKKKRDVEHLNQLQVLNCLENLYFSGPFSGYIDSLVRKYISRKRAKPFEIVELFELVGEEGVFVRKDDGRQIDESRSVIHNTAIPIEPDFRVSFLKMKEKKSFAETGTGAGILRDPAWHEIVDDFSRELSAQRVRLSDIRTFAGRHALWPRAGPWKNGVF